MLVAPLSIAANLLSIAPTDSSLFCPSEIVGPKRRDAVGDAVVFRGYQS